MDATAVLAPDILAQLAIDFPEEEWQARRQQVVRAFGDDRTRRCVVWAARGHGSYFDLLCRLDYRDVIAAAEYERLGTQLYDFNKPIPEARLVIS